MSFDWSHAAERWEGALLFLLATALAARYLLLRPAFHGVRELGKDASREIRRLYRGRALVGWLAILASAALIEWVLFFYCPCPLSRVEAFLVAAILFLSGVFHQLAALHEATVFVAANRIEEERETA
ncbi:MAG: hypothetical protein HY714_00225 [Candidatus Omnitrophica bacterium]|nr:hypothetical protein [Candidatus Omnitrophota bacterium]